jgi:hypothetical protein
MQSVSKDTQTKISGFCGVGNDGKISSVTLAIFIPQFGLFWLIFGLDFVNIYLRKAGN